jgi:hypothetical protein
MTVQLKTLTKEDFQNCLRKWPERWDKCVRSPGGGGCIFWGIYGNGSFSAKNFFYLNIHRIFWSHLVSCNFFRNSLNTSICMHKLCFKHFTVILVTEVFCRLSITTLLVGFCYVFQTYNIFWPQVALIQYQ